jgi:hypothetical protein
MPAEKLIAAAYVPSDELRPRMTRLDFDTLATVGSFADVTEQKAFATLGASADPMIATKASSLPRWVAVTNDARRFVASLPWAWHARPHVSGLALVKTVDAPRWMPVIRDGEGFSNSSPAAFRGRPDRDYPRRERREFQEAKLGRLARRHGSFARLRS